MSTTMMRELRSAEPDTEAAARPPVDSLPETGTTTAPPLGVEGRTAQAIAAGDGRLGQLPIISIAFALGWELAEVDLSTRAVIAIERRTQAGELPKAGPAAEENAIRRELASLRTLALQAPHAVVLPRINARLARLGSEFTGHAMPTTTELKAALARTPSRRVAAVERSVFALHEEIATMLNETDSRLAAAYDLGRELAYVTQTPDSAREFLADPSNHDQISQPLADLSSALPPHSSRAVQLSLAAWHEWLSRSALDGRQGALGHCRARLRALRFNPSSRPLWRPRIDAQPGQGSEISDSEYLKRQGQIWRALLAGEKDVDSMMDTSNYEKAAHQLFRRGGSLVWRLMWTNKWAVAMVLALIGAGTYAVVSFDGAAKVITFGTAVLGLFGVSVKSASNALTTLSARIGKELWSSEVDVAVAQAITRLPRGDQALLRFDTLTERHRAPGPERQVLLMW